MPVGDHWDFWFRIAGFVGLHSNLVETLEDTRRFESWRTRLDSIWDIYIYICCVYIYMYLEIHVYMVATHIYIRALRKIENCLDLGMVRGKRWDRPSIFKALNKENAVQRTR